MRMNISNSGAGQTTTFDGDGFSGTITSTHSGFQESHTDLGSEKIDRYDSRQSVGGNYNVETNGNSCHVTAGAVAENRAMGDAVTVIGDTRELTGSVQSDYDKAKADLIAQRSVYPDNRMDAPNPMDFINELIEPPTELLTSFSVTVDPKESPIPPNNFLADIADTIAQITDA